MRILIGVFLACLLSTPAQAQQVATDPLHVTIALAGVSLSVAGFAMMLHTRPNGNSDPGWVTGGAFVVSGGVLMTYIGLHTGKVTVAPVITRRTLGAAGTIRWGGK